jgi:hypothetical protein
MNIKEKEIHKDFNFPLILNYTERLAVNTEIVCIFEFIYDSFLFTRESKLNLIRIVNGDLLIKIKLRGIKFGRRLGEDNLYITVNDSDFLRLVNTRYAKEILEEQSDYIVNLKRIDLADLIIRRLNQSLINNSQ